MSLRERKRIEPSQYPSLLENFRKYLAKCLKKLKLSEEDYYFRKARLRMSKEMDIKNFIKSLRTNRNTIKFLTTQPERRFVRMQADKIVLVLNDQAEKDLLEKDAGDLSPTELNALIGDSSAFTSEDYGKYVDKMREMVTKKHKILTDRE